MKQFKPSLSVLILRDGTLYFIVLSVLNIITLIIDVLARYNPALVGAANFMFITEAIAPVLIARFILDLRSVCYPDPHNDTTITTLSFVSNSFLGNLAAPFGGERSTWLIGTTDDGTVEKYEESEHPLSIGLVPVDSSAAFEFPLEDLSGPEELEAHYGRSQRGSGFAF